MVAKTGDDGLRGAAAACILAAARHAPIRRVARAVAGMDA
jgi:hypothetical protein